MKANELRIGNWGRLKEHDAIIQIEQYQLCDSELINLQPIQLTEEWLLKFGFEKALNGYWCNKDFMNVKFSPNIEIYLSGDDYDLAHNEFKYVHQLQNLYFALTGEELTYGGNK